jgi:hypothetical protein
MNTHSLPTPAHAPLRPTRVAGLADVVLFVLIAYALMWAALLAYVVPNWGSLTTAEAFPYAMIGQFGPTLAALGLTARREGWSGVRALLGHLLATRFPLRWWVVATWVLGLIFLAVSVIIGASLSLGETMAWLVTRWPVVLLPVFGVANALLGAGPIGEEIAWRGYLQPRLIDRWSPARSSVVLGLIWSFWHLPAFFIPDWRHGLDLPLYVVLYPVSTIVISYGMYYLWKNTGGSLLAAVLFHGCLNWAASSLQPAFVNPVVLYLGTITVAGVWGLIARRLDDRSLPANPYATIPRA